MKMWDFIIVCYNRRLLLISKRPIDHLPRIEKCQIDWVKNKNIEFKIGTEYDLLSNIIFSIVYYQLKSN